MFGFTALVLLCASPAFAACTFVAASAPVFDAKTYHVGGEATIPATGTTQNCTFNITTLPATGTVVALQGTITFRSSCTADALSTVSVNGSTKYYSSAIKIGNGGGVQTIFINYTIPLSFTSSEPASPLAVTSLPVVAHRAIGSYKQHFSFNKWRIYGERIFQSIP